uniref:Uncharacterized protein n=1 Tax=Anguilla anguilla TaxID=7936 RepID=A0A0E9WLV7_ANGAN
MWGAYRSSQPSSFQNETPVGEVILLLIGMGVVGGSCFGHVLPAPHSSHLGPYTPGASVLTLLVFRPPQQR